jgi:hypothetical protein
VSDIPLRSGDFVWTQFPSESEPDVPGPIPHAARVIAVFSFSQRDAGVATPAPVPGRALVVGAYTSPQVEKFGDASPLGSFRCQQNELPKAVTNRHFSLMSASKPSFRLLANSSTSLISLVSA